MPSSFRVRVFALIVLVSVVSVSATAWLTVRATTAGYEDSAAVASSTAQRINAALAAYGAYHGTWAGVPATVRALSLQTGQRIKLSTLDGAVIADSDTLANRIARPVSARPGTIIDPRPRLDLPRVTSLGYLTKLVFAQLAQDRIELRFASCLTWAGIRFHRDGDTITPQGSPDPAVVRTCEGQATDTAADEKGDNAAIAACATVAVTPVSQPNSGAGVPVTSQCAVKAFVARISLVAPVPLQLDLGYRNETSLVHFSMRRVIATVAAMMLLMIFGTVLLSRRLLTSVAALSQASRRLSMGDLSSRVRVSGSDELAYLTATFNMMADSLQRSEEQQRRMISDVAHELRTPLANIRGYLEALRDGMLEPDPDLFASLHDEAVLQQRLVDDLQELALAESGGLTYHRMRLDLSELLETCRTAHSAVAESAAVRLEVETGDLPLIRADPDRLRQAVGNLVTNALKATPPGGSVILRGFTSMGDVVITVTDDGRGIATDQLPHVFDRFWRADGARGRTTGGRGLGLAIARHIIAAHGGTITASSTLGVGSVFTIRLPVAAPAVEAPERRG